MYVFLHNVCFPRCYTTVENMKSSMESFISVSQQNGSKGIIIVVVNIIILPNL
jgi:hypothetical protein